MISQNKNSKGKFGESTILFKEITQVNTWPIELLNNLAPKHRIYGLIEVDVTKARKFISENEVKTGEKLSFTAWVIKCIAQSISEQKEIQAIKKGKRKLIVFNDIDVGLIVEIKVGSRRGPTQHIVRKAQEKSFREIHKEIRQVQNKEHESSKPSPSSKPLMLRLPGILRKPYWWRIKSDPVMRKKYFGTVGVTAVGMFGQGGGWAIPIGLHQVVFALGGISKKLKDQTKPLDFEEYLNVTVMFDEEVSLGAPATRFINRLAELMQSGFGLE